MSRNTERSKNEARETSEEQARSGREAVENAPLVQLTEDEVTAPEGEEFTFEPLPVLDISQEEIERLSRQERGELLKPFLERFFRRYVDISDQIPGYKHIVFRDLESISLYPYVGGKALITAQKSFVTPIDDKSNHLYQLEFVMTDELLEQLERAIDETELLEDGTTRSTINGQQKMRIEIIPHPLTPPEVEPDQLYTDPEHVFTLLELALLGTLQTAISEEEREFVFRLAFREGGTQDEKEAEKKPRRERITGSTTLLMNSPLTKAIFDPHNENYFRGQDYFNEEGKPVNIGEGKNAQLAVLAPEGTDITVDPSSYELSAPEDFWHNAVATLAARGRRSMSGMEILKQADISNPYSASSRKSMTEASRCIARLLTTPIFYDATEEAVKEPREGKPLTRRIGMTPIIYGRMELDEYSDEDGSIYDFTLHLAEEDPLDSLPLARYDVERRQIIEAPRKHPAFKGMRLELKHKQAWRYIEKRVGEHGTNNIILWDTLFKSMGIQGTTKAEKDARRRFENTVRKMLDRACGKGGANKKDRQFKSWERHRDKDGAVIGFKITPLDPEEKD